MGEDFFALAADTAALHARLLVFLTLCVFFDSLVLKSSAPIPSMPAVRVASSSQK